jgi:hypothetical protein
METAHPPLRAPVLAACLYSLAAVAPLAFEASAAARAAGPAPRSEVLELRVDVGADGHITASRPMDSSLPLNAIAQRYAAKLAFSPARSNGRAVASTTCLTVGLVAEPQPDGNFALRLKRAVNGPCVAVVGKANPPRIPRGQGALVVIGANLLADGRVDAASMAAERTELRVPSSFDASRFVTAAQRSLRDSRFELDTVDGKPVTAHVSAPFRFGGGPARQKPDEEEARHGAPPPGEFMLPSWNATSTVAGVELPKIDYTQP